MGLFSFLKKKTTKTTNQPAEKKVIQQEFIATATTNADKLVNSFNDKLEHVLDYSIGSLQVLDQEILSLFHDNKDDMGDGLLEEIAAQAGSYVFEVARRTFGGTYYWYDALNQPILVTGQPSFEISLLVYEKVKGRILNGDEDHIPYFFKGFEEKVLNARPGDKAMIR